METQRICPNCRKPLPPDVPLGLCPECLIKSGFPTEGAGGVSGETVGARFVPPPVDEIARLFPQLEILGLIGKGGMGAVYKARQPMLDRFIALKVLPPAVAGDPGFAERFNREARALARLNHPNIVAVYDFGKAGDLHYLLMEFVDGTNLRQVEQAGKLSSGQALTIVPKICEALQYAHDQGVVHRDIKPENILLDKSGRVKIADFGIAKMVGQGPTDVSLTGARDVVGTPHYMAPEQIEKPQAVDHRADIYSLGVVFYEMLTGELPLGKFSPPSKKVEVDVRLDEVVLHTLEKEPERRYQQVSQVKTDVETITGTKGPAGKSGAASPAFAAQADRAASDKAILPALLLAFPFGLFGAHRFYVGKTGTAFLQLGTLFGWIVLIVACAHGAPQPLTGLLLGGLILGCFIWAIVDWILILCKAFTDGQGRRMSYWLHPQNGNSKTGTRPITGSPSSPPPGGAIPSANAEAQPAPITPGTAPAASSGMIVAPAVGLIVAAIWKLFSALMAWLFLAGVFTNPWLGNLRDFGLGSFSHWSALAGFSILLFKVIPALLILVGAIQMLRLRSYAWAMTAAILSVVACSLIGLPMGIWAMIVLARQDVRETFARTTASPTSRSGPWLWLAAAGVGLVLIVAGLITVVSLIREAVEQKPAADGTPAGIVQEDKANEPSTPKIVPPARAPAIPPTTASTEMPAPPKSAGTLNPPEAHGEKIIGNLSSSDPFQQDFNQTFPLSDQGRLNLDNVNGRIEIAGWDRNEVVIQALKHGKTQESVAATTIKVDASVDEIAIHTEEPPNQTGFSGFWSWFQNGGNNKATVDYAIQVPRHTRLANVSSVNGRVEIDRVGGDIESSTVNGAIKVQDVAGNLKLSTVNGRIETELASLGGNQSVSLTTVNGAIEATLPSNANAEITANTINGGMSSDFPELVVKKQFPLSKDLKGTLGNGAATVKVSTVNGSIHFQRGNDAR
ncbi:MAG TPA: protein kinase [Candidatus Sulfopaludibacter sp.]|nr:protein kinase [Candidatus Sulfopaludibacter sp.]